MIKFIMEYLERIGADQISFRKLGNDGMGTHLNIQVEELTNFNQSGYVSVTDRLIAGVEVDDNLDDYVFRTLQNNYNYGMNNKSQFNKGHSEKKDDMKT